MPEAVQPGCDPEREGKGGVANRDDALLTEVAWDEPPRSGDVERADPGTPREAGV
jgi:hypothetical protein